MRSLILNFSLYIAATLSLTAQSDNCTAATMLGAADLTSGIMTAGATTADNTSSGFWGGIPPQMNLTCDASNTYTIDEWWRIDIATGNDLMIDIASPTNHMVAIVEATTANCGTPNLNTFLGCMDQAVTTSMIFENCFAAATTYYIVVLTNVANQGTYDLTVTEILTTGTSPSAVGDDCMNAIILDPIGDGTDGTTITCGANNVSGTSINNFQEAKGDNVFDSPCIEASEATVWYSFTAGDDVYIENTTSTNLSVALYSGVCGALTLIDCDAAGNIQEVDALIPGDIYFIQVAFPYGFDGTFDICVNSPLAPLGGDDCSSPEVLTLVNGATTSAVQMDNFGATSTGESFTPTLISSCGAGSMSTIYYEFTIGGVANTHLNINYDEAGATPISNSQITILLDCTSTMAFNGFEWTGSTDEDICLMPGTYIIQIASCDADEGSYTLALTPNTPPGNDDCVNATEFNDPITMGGVPIVPAICEVYNVQGTTVNACPEATALGSTCEFDTEATVWFTFTTDGTADQEAEITLTPSGGTPIVNGTFALLEGPVCPGTLVGTCQTDLTEANISLTPGVQYFIAVSQQSIGTEGTFDLDIEITSILTNDDCNLGTNPDILLSGTGTTTCADHEVNTCGVTNTTDDHQVFYTYTNTSGSTVDLELTIEADATNGLPATQVSITAFEADCSLATGFYSAPLSNSEWCDILGMGMQTLPCIEDGETIILVFSSAEDDEGEFTITANEGGMQPVGDNDECDLVLPDITPANTCEWETVTADNNNACPEDFVFGAGCDFDMDPTVWYSFTVPAAPGNYTLEIQNITDASSYLTIFDSGIDCNAPGAAALSADCETGAGPHNMYDPLTPGATYFIAFGNPTPGIYSFEIKINLLPDNDECIDAVALVANTTTMGTTICATQEIISYDSGVCTDPDETNTVWYEVTVNPGEKGFNLTLTGTGTMPISGDINVVLFETFGCVVDASTFTEEDCMTSGVLSSQFECVGEGTYIIRISTSDANAGEFDILFEPQLLVQPNDNCDAPDLSLDTGAECEWILATANTVGACPEDVFLDPTGCGLSSGSVVWYEVTAPLTAIFLDLQINSDGGSNPFIAVFPGSPADCDNQTFVAGTTCYEGLFTELDDLGQAQIAVTGGSTYLIAIGITDPAGNTIDFGIRWITPPVNDECADAIMLVGNVGTDGTTDCATQPIGGEYNSGVCTDEDEENTVWYTYEVPATDKGFNVTINAAFGAPGFSGDMNLVVFEPDPIGSCDVSAGTMVDEICTNSAVINEEFECIGPGTYVIRISTSGDNEGDFTITIEPLAIVQPNDFCDAPDVATFAPQSECEWMTVDANTVDACPESFDFASNCGFDDFPVIWYEATAPANAEFLDLQINSGGTNPFIGVFEFTIDCDNLTPVAGSSCYTGTFDELDDLGQLQIDVTPGTTYLIGVGTNNTAGNIIDFGIKWITPPINDDCIDAIALTPNMAGTDPGTFTTGPIAGTTQCATAPITGSACDEDKTNTVWYTYMVEADVKEITIDITNWVNTVIPQGLPDFSVAVLDGCPPATFLNQADGSVADYCGGVGVDLIKLSCLDEGDIITILVSSSAENEGTFDITLNTAEPNCVYTNDECINSEPLTPTPIDTDEDCVITAGCNDLACSEFNFAACAGIDQLNTVFYTFTTDADADEAFVNIEITNGEVGELDSPGAVLFNGDCVTPLSIGACGAGTGGEYTSGPLGGPGLIMANTTYTVMIFNSDVNQNGGTFDLCLTVTSGCVNDQPCDAFTLEPGIPVLNPASSENCTPDVSISGCNAELDEATLWYQVEVPEGYSYFTITLINGGVPDGVGEGLGEVSIAVGPLDNCNNIVAGDVIYADCTGFTTEGGVHPIPCAIEYGTYYIQIGSADELDAGDFEITFTPLDDIDPINDLCSQATEVDVPDFCMFFPFAGDLKDACPEINDVNGCLFSENSAVWYKITIPGGVPVVSDMDIMIEGLGNPILGVYEFDCSQVSEPSMGIISTPNLGDGSTAGCVQMDLAEGIVITPGNEYYILVSSSTNEQLPFTLNIKLNAPPINDDPCDASINPPYDLTGGGSHSGTTCCARGPNDSNPDGSAADLGNVECSNATEDAAVWYQFTPSEADDGYDIILEPGDIEGPTSLEVYTGAPGAGCSGTLTAIASSCNSNNAYIKISNCFEPGDILYVKVSTDDPDENCGTFFLTIVPATCGPMADDCIDLADQTPIEPVTNEFFFIDYFCVTGCLDYACPEDNTNGGCGEFATMPTVWFQVTADELAAQMFTTVEPFGNWDPIWSVYSGPDCDNLTVVNFGGSPPCSNGDNTPELHQTSVFDDEENYWISITVDPGSLPPSGIDDGGFELCVATTINAIICLGELEGGACDDESLVMEIIDREIEGQPLTGPFCQGEEVTVNISFFYDASDSGADWLIGFVPVFGPGWDLEGFDYTANAPVGNGQTAQWYEEGGDCAPILQEPNPILCTYTDENGNLQLCNLLCSPCSECPQPFMYPNDPLPSGYFWVSNGGNAGCDNDCSPGEGWGIGSIQSQIDWTFTLNVKEFESFEDCFENNSLSIGFQTFSDGTAGCWEDPVGECLLDRAMFSPNWEIECEIPPAVEGPDEELCHDGVTNIFVQTEDGSTTTIIVDVEDNPNVTGEMDYVFTGGTGTIMDDLLNLTNDVQIVLYTVYAEDETLPCPGPINEIEVTIYPELKATFPPTFVCEGECANLTPDIVGGIGAPHIYSWSNGESSSIITVCPVVPTTYFVTIEDALGCIDIAEVQVDVKPPVEIELPESIDVCKDDNFDPNNPDYIVCLDFISGSSPYGVVWTPEVGLVGNSSGVFGECFIINEMASSEFAGNNGQYVLSVTVTDFFGCMAMTDMLVNITGPLTIIATVLDLECGDTEASISVTGIDAVGNPVTTFFLYGGCPDNGLGDFLEEINPNNGTGTFPPVDLLSYTCFTIVGQTEAGCQSTQDIIIPLTEGIPIDITGTPNVCIGDDATITINNESDYISFVWTPNVGSTGSVTFTPDSTFTYFVEATDATGCKSQATFTVTVNDPPNISMSGSTTFCEGGTASVTASGGVMYNWTSSISGFPMTGPTISVGEPGDVTLNLTDANGCSSDTTITFTQEDIITISLGDVDICDGMGDTVFVSNDFINIEWYDSTPTLVSDTSFYVITGAGSFTVQAIDATTGCDAMGSFVVMDFMTPMISVTDTVEVCRLDSGIDSTCVNFNNQVSGSAGSWSQVTPIPGFTVDLSDLNNVCFEGAQTGCYAFTYTTNNAQDPCMDVSETMIVCVKACPCPSPATQPIAPKCNIGTINLALAEVTTSAGTWSVESGPAGQDLTGILTGKIFNASGLLAGDYVVRFTLTNPGQPPVCLQFSEQTITIFARPIVTGMNDFMCNIDNGTDPIVLDLFDLISVDASDGGTWVETSTTGIPITGGSTIMSSDLSTFPQTLTFEYTSGVEAGSPCPPAVVSVEVVVRDCNCPFVDVLPDTLCNNGGLIDLNTLLVNPDGLAGTWSTTGNLVGLDMFDPAGLPSGIYTITFTLDQLPGPNCDQAYTDNILIRRQSIAVPTTAEPPCSIDTGNGPTTSNLYDWLETGYSSGGWTQTGGTTISFTDNGLDMAVVDFVTQAVGSMFTFTFTTNDAQNPCTNVSVDVTITVEDCNCPPIVLDPATDVCNDDDMIDLCDLSDGSDPGTFTVTSIGGTDFSDRINGCLFDATGLNPGEYVITFTLDQVVTGTCTQSLSVNFNVSQYLSVTGDMTAEVCSDENGNGVTSLNFTSLVSNAAAGTWIDVDGSGVAISNISEQMDVSFVGVPNGSYTFTYTIDNADPCEDFVHTLVVSVTDDCNCPSINPLNPSDECNTDGPIDLTQFDDPIRPGTWSSTDLTVNNGNSLDIDGVLSGSYVLTYKIQDIVPDCDSTVEVMILIGEPGNAGMPGEAFRLCEGDSEVVDLSNLLDGEDVGGTWSEISTSGGFDGANATFTTDNEVAGTYTFEYTLSNNDPCPPVSATVTVIIDPNPIADAGAEQFIDCENTSASLGGPNTTTGTDITYSWVNTTTGEDAGSTANIDVVNAGIYELTVINTSTGCSARGTVEVLKSDDLPTMIVDPTDITCFGFDDGGVTLSGQTGGDGNYTYSLNGAASTSDPNDFSTLPAGDYTISIMDGNGCIQEYSFTISEPPAIFVDAGPEIITGDVGESFDLSILPFDTIGVTSIVWSDFETGEVLCTGLGCTTINVSPMNVTTTYYVEVMNANGCTAFDQVQIQLQQIVDVVFPNIITPNGDNINDGFYVKSGDVETIISMKIFDRWGEKLFDLGNFPPRDPAFGWDGKFNGKKVVPGVYVYTVEILFINGDTQTFSGDVTVTDSE